MFKEMKLRSKMLVFILSFNLTILVVTFFVYYNCSKTILVNETQVKIVEQVNSAANAIEGYFQEKGKIAWTFCNNPYFKQWLRQNTRRGIDYSNDPMYRNIVSHFKQIVAKDKEIKSAFVASEMTREYYDDAESPNPEDLNIGSRPWYVETVKLGRPYFNCDIDILDQKVYIAYQHPIYDENRELLGIGGIDISLDNIDEFLSTLDMFKTSQTFLIGEDGTIIYHPREEWILAKNIVDFRDDGKRFKNMKRLQNKISDKQGGVESVLFDGEERYFIHRPIESLNWTLLLSVPAKEVNAPLRIMSRISLLIIFAASILLIFAIIFFTKTITKPIEKIVAMIKDVAEGQGDLTKRLYSQTRDELGELVHWFNTFIQKLHDIISQVKGNTDEVANATSQISAVSRQLAAGVERQNNQVQEITVNMQEMTLAIENNSRTANETANMSEKASSSAQEGSEAMAGTQKEMTRIVSSTENTQETIRSLLNRIDEIGDTIRIIDDIAEQAKILGVNAAIEAASAGKQGKGFEVVAQEVQRFAERTMEATKTITKMMNNVQKETQEVTASMETVLDVVKRGEKAIEQTEAIFQRIMETVVASSDMVRRIAANSEQQSSGAREMSGRMELIGTITTESANGAEQMSAAANHLHQQTEVLKNIVDQFMIHEDI